MTFAFVLALALLGRGCLVGCQVSNGFPGCCLPKSMLAVRQVLVLAIIRDEPLNAQAQKCVRVVFRAFFFLPFPA